MDFRQHKILVAALILASTMLPTGCDNDDIFDDDSDNPGEGFRAPTAASKPNANKVYEFTPAPGQFINQTDPGMSWTQSTTPTEAAEWALGRLNNGLYVSLGSFGGYIVVGFDHSIARRSDDYEIGIIGNAFNSRAGDSNEPGIVYVMQDTNANGLPDDTWYELRGSATQDPGTIRYYAVTYYRPESEGKPVRWTDNQGGEGEVPYLGMFHNQPYYYPVWIKSPTYTLSGTRLESKTTRLESGNWSNPPYGWGYADNMGEDVISLNDSQNCNRFRISDAIDADGKSVQLEYIDFVKVQTGVMSTAGILGEVSTEVLGVIDLTLK